MSHISTRNAARATPAIKDFRSLRQVYVAESVLFLIWYGRRNPGFFTDNKSLDAFVNSAHLPDITEFAKANRDPEMPAFFPDAGGRGR